MAIGRILWRRVWVAMKTNDTVITQSYSMELPDVIVHVIVPAKDSFYVPAIEHCCEQAAVDCRW